MSQTPDFSHFKKLDPTDRTAEYLLPVPGVDVTLELVHAGQGNKDYTRALAKWNTHQAQNVTNKTDASDILEIKTSGDRMLFPKYVVKGWSGVEDANGEEVPFSQDACVAFFKVLPSWVIARISSFAGNERNFIDKTFGAESVDTEGAEAVAKN